ncbi:(2Fe-2S) ferredoxin domain-containing protein [Pannus brasiliensis CCIBt3594]|uniref:(2Fe-2S) ferredoxin domain-containing protein n=1 Tax=Pannus brasiliensis CCIBt3594 TaxID=1427578 RepID=A0AAW9QPN4_9CHRO
MGLQLTTPFQIEGEFLRFVGKTTDKIKSLQVLVGDRTVKIIIAKEARGHLSRDFLPGDRVQILGLQKVKEDGKKIKFKAYQIDRLSCSLNCPAAHTQTCTKVNSISGKILLCHKSGCAKHGGKAIYRALEEAIDRYGLGDSVKIETTGCQKRCGQAPNLIMMPSKQKYGRVYPKKVHHLVRDHFLALSENHG